MTWLVIKWDISRTEISGPFENEIAAAKAAADAEEEWEHVGILGPIAFRETGPREG